MTSNRRALGRAVSLATLSLAACTSGQVGQYPLTSVNPATNSKLQFGVGWATRANPATSYGINLVETFRQQNGRSAVLADTTTIAVPTALAKQLFTQNLGFQLAAPLLPEALGAGFNNGNFPTVGAQFQPDAGAGGPPAFPIPADTTSLTQQFSEGYFVAFPVSTGADLGLVLADALATFPGSYTLKVTYATGASTTQSAGAQAVLGGTPLPTYAAPGVAVDGSGGAIVTVNVPAGVTETLVTVQGLACQNVAATATAPATVLETPEVYTLLSQRPGPGVDRLSLPDFVTPIGGLGPYQSLCSSAQLNGLSGNFAAYAVGFDYPAFESVYPQSFSQTPTIIGATGRPDVTISAPTTFVTP